MNELIFVRGEGNIPKSLPNEDHVSGLLCYLEKGILGAMKDFTPGDEIHAISSLETAKKYGIVADAEKWSVRVLYYHLSEIFRVNPGILLYVGVYDCDGGATEFPEIEKMQRYAGGAIRQIGVYNPNLDLKKTDLNKLQGIADNLELESAPLSILYAATSECDGKNDHPEYKDITGIGNPNVSVVIGQEGDPNSFAYELHNSKDANGKSVSALGTVLGLVSKAAVNESISWVSKFPTGIVLPALTNGLLMRSLDRADINDLDKARLIFFRTYPGLSGSYVNDSHNMNEPISDYPNIESVRTMDKAVRGIRTYLLPELGRPLYIDAKTGKLRTYTIEYLKTRANKALEDMEKAGELSGYSVDIDPAQNVLSTSTVEFIIKNVAVGVMRKVRVKIGYAESTK